MTQNFVKIAQEVYWYCIASGRWCILVSSFFLFVCNALQLQILW